jgi:hypothetical protein
MLKNNEIIKYNDFNQIIFATVIHFDTTRQQYLIDVFFPEEKKAPIRISGSERGLNRVIKNYGVVDNTTFFDEYPEALI